MNIFKNKLFMIGGSSSMAVVVLSGSLYYSLLLRPKMIASSFISEAESNFTKEKEDFSALSSIVSNWDEISKGDIDKKEEDLKRIKNDFLDAKNKLDKLTPSLELKDTYENLKRFSEKGAEVSENLYTIASYFKKTEEAVKAFNGLNTDSSSLDQVTQLVMDFKSVSQTALTELEKVEAPKLLINLDKDYKDLLRQYISSADALSSAINDKNEKKIESVGNESDAAVEAIDKQIDEDLETFKENSKFDQAILVMQGFEKSIEENLGNLKAKYKI